MDGGTGPNHGRFGALGRNTFRGPAYYDFDFALIKSTPIGRRSSGIELMDLQFRAEFFNIFNIVNMGLPANTLVGAGFGEISRTAGTSRQIQFSLKLIYYALISGPCPRELQFCLNISMRDPRNRRSLGFARNDKGKAN